MQRLRAIQFDRPQQNETALSLVKQSSALLPKSSAEALMVLMDQMQAYFPHQAIPQETATVWMSRWAELTQTFGLEIFTASLLKVVHRSEFMPLPTKIEAECSLQLSQQRAKEAQDKHRREMDELERMRGDRLEHPENYVSIASIVQELSTAKGNK